jgi:hypothetical protein
MSIHDLTKEKARPPTASSGSLPSKSIPSSSSPTNHLIDHLLAAKRSLVAINDVWRANELVTRAQEALEESVVLAARIGFINRAIESQRIFLKRIRNGIESIGRKAHHEFEVCCLTVSRILLIRNS